MGTVCDALMGVLGDDVLTVGRGGDAPYFGGGERYRSTVSLTHDPQERAASAIPDER